MTEKRIKVLVTGLGGASVGMQVLKALRLAATKYVILGADMSEDSLGLRLADEGFILPPASAPNYLEELTGLCGREGVDALVPGSDRELLTLARNREELENRGVHMPANSLEVVEQCLDKRATFKRLAELDVPIPDTLVPEEDGQWRTFDSFPCVVKPYLSGGGSSDVFIARDMEELEFFCRYLSKGGVRPMIQAYVGTEGEEYTVGVLCDEDGGVLISTCMRRSIMEGLSNRAKARSLDGKSTLAVSSGVSQGRFVNDGNIIRQCETIATRLRSTGPLNIQCRMVDGVVYPFEINPRFSGTTHFRALAGVNEPDILIRRRLLGDQTVPSGFKEGMCQRRLEEFLFE